MTTILYSIFNLIVRMISVFLLPLLFSIFLALTTYCESVANFNTEHFSPLQKSLAINQGNQIISYSQLENCKQKLTYCAEEINTFINSPNKLLNFNNYLGNPAPYGRSSSLCYFCFKCSNYYLFIYITFYFFK